MIFFISRFRGTDESSSDEKFELGSVRSVTDRQQRQQRQQQQQQFGRTTFSSQITFLFKLFNREQSQLPKI